MVRTRIAPSPTGEFHVGHIRTLLYNYALAKNAGGTFVVRIEDTDRERYVPGAVEKILEIIKDYGLSWDEGPIVGGPYAPYVQSERLDIYKKYSLELVEKGAAYYCFCTSERLDEMRAKQRELGYAATRYDGRCRDLSNTEVTKKLAAKMPFVIRLKVPKDQKITFHDEVLGDMSFDSNEIDDQVLLKSDGFPTYQLAVVIDDHLMNITHVMRGIDWLPSTPKHVLLYQAFGWEFPKHIHLPNLKEVGENKKLSKRHGSVAALEFLQEGYLPEAILNFLMLLGWSPKVEKEIMTVPEFVAEFAIDRIHQTDLVAFDRQKLLWLNGAYIRNMAVAELYDRLTRWSQKFGVNINTTGFDRIYIEKVLTLTQDRLKLLSDFPILSNYFFTEPNIDVDLLVKQSKDVAKCQEIIIKFITAVANIPNWTKENLEVVGHQVLLDNNYKPKEAFMTIRITVCGVEATPPLFDTLEVLGKDVVLKRLEKALNDCPAKT
ncbi:MAG: glutamate--tRNA ligase [candidate division WWE3 bacterium]|nr:glutamate--tRNA ligase [candidate division WWE3 bacterium]